MTLDSTSTTRIGLPPKSEDRPPGIDDGIRNRGYMGNGFENWTTAILIRCPI